MFKDREDLDRRLNDPELDVTAESVLVLQNAGPRGGPGMPEWGMIPLPIKLIQLGVSDMVRISDARMSGTSHGTTVLHVAPESFIGGPLALVRNGDIIELDVAARRLELIVSPDELAARREAWTEPRLDSIVDGAPSLPRTSCSPMRAVTSRCSVGEEEHQNRPSTIERRRAWLVAVRTASKTWHLDDFDHRHAAAPRVSTQSERVRAGEHPSTR